MKSLAHLLKKELQEKKILSFAEIFNYNQPLLKRIGTFLAALELFRSGELHIEKRDDGYYFRA